MNLKINQKAKNLLMMFFLHATVFVYSAHIALAQKNETGNDKSVVEILEKHIAAIGGRAAWKTIKTIETLSEREIFGGTTKLYILADRQTGRSYSLTESADQGKTEIGFDGQKVWRKAPFFKGYLSDTDPQAKAIKNRRPPLYLYEENKWKFERMPDEIVSSKKYIVLRSIENDPLGNEVESKYYLDPETYLLRQKTSGTVFAQTTTFDDYRKIDGKTTAFSTVTVKAYSFLLQQSSSSATPTG